MLAKHQARSLELPPTLCSCRSAHQGRCCLAVEGDQCDSSPPALAAARGGEQVARDAPLSAVHTNAPESPRSVTQAVGHESSVAEQAS